MDGQIVSGELVSSECGMDFKHCARSILVVCWLAIVVAAAGCTARLPQPASAPGTPPVTAVAHANLTPSLVMGEQSCAASGCHGRIFDGQSRDWRAAWSIWREEDPHRRAFEVLYSDRSLEIYRNFHPEAKHT